MNDFGIKNTDQVAPASNSYRGTLKRQPAFDTFDGSLFAVFPSLNEEQTLQEVPTGLDSISHDSANCELPLLTPCSKAVMSQALKATFSGFKKEQRRLGIPKSKCVLVVSLSPRCTPTTNLTAVASADALTQHCCWGLRTPLGGLLLWPVSGTHLDFVGRSGVTAV